MAQDFSAQRTQSETADGPAVEDGNLKPNLLADLI